MEEYSIYNIGDFIRAERERQGIKAYALADKAGYSAAHVSRIETGFNPPSFTSLCNILDVLGYDFVIIPRRKNDGTQDV